MSTQYEKPSAVRVRDSYLNPDQNNVAVMTEIAARAGLRVSCDESGKIRVKWETMSQDFVVFDLIVDVIISTLYQDDARYDLEVLPQIRELALQSPLFHRLNDNTIVRSPAHQNRNPFEHTFDVAKLINSDQATDQDEKFWLRFYPIIHDIAKVAIAYQDHFQIHARLSGYILTEYLESRGVQTHYAQEWSKPVHLHHIFELIDRNIITKDEAITLIGDERMLGILSLLSFADAASVELHMEHAFSNAKQALESLLQLCKGMPKFAEIFASIVIKSIQVLIESLTNIGNDLLEKIDGFLQTVERDLHMDVYPIRTALIPCRTAQ